MQDKQDGAFASLCTGPEPRFNSNKREVSSCFGLLFLFNQMNNENSLIFCAVHSLF